MCIWSKIRYAWISLDFPRELLLSLPSPKATWTNSWKKFPSFPTFYNGTIIGPLACCFLCIVFFLQWRLWRCYICSQKSNKMNKQNSPPKLCKNLSWSLPFFIFCTPHRLPKCGWGGDLSPNIGRSLIAQFFVLCFFFWGDTPRPWPKSLGNQFEQRFLKVSEKNPITKHRNHLGVHFLFNYLHLPHPWSSHLILNVCKIILNQTEVPHPNLNFSQFHTPTATPLMG